MDAPLIGGGYPRDAGIPILRRSVVAFVDLLGTKEYASSSRAQETLEALDVALRLARDQADLNAASNWFHAEWFSDNLGIAAPLPDDRIFEESSIGFVFIALIWLQFRLSIEGFFVRGGLTVGSQFADDAITFGPALVEAVRLDSIAVNPRVVVDAHALAIVNEHYPDHGLVAENPFHHELMIDEHDGLVFLSYLSASQESDDPEQAHMMLSRHRAAVEEQLALSHPAGVAAKYEWVADYHDAYCGFFFPNWPELLLPQREGVRRGFRQYSP